MYEDKFPSIQRQSYHPIKTLASDYRRPLTSICRASQKYHNKVWSTHFPLLSCAPLGKRQSPRIMIHFHQLWPIWLALPDCRPRKRVSRPRKQHLLRASIHPFHHHKCSVLPPPPLRRRRRSPPACSAVRKEAKVGLPPSLPQVANPISCCSLRTRRKRRKRRQEIASAAAAAAAPGLRPTD